MTVTRDLRRSNRCYSRLTGVSSRLMAESTSVDTRYRSVAQPARGDQAAASEMVSEVIAAHFKREMEVTAQLHHPHILPVLSEPMAKLDI